VVTFLALLELVHMGLIKVYQPSEQSRIRLTACFDESDSVVYGMNDGK
jgi:chromatin segregation and condensation protein Rec8/ScpA/Scc1 (kleisin family)